jgi:hypothetical protein
MRRNRPPAGLDGAANLGDDLCMMASIAAPEDFMP